MKTIAVAAAAVALVATQASAYPFHPPVNVYVPGHDEPSWWGLFPAEPPIIPSYLDQASEAPGAQGEKPVEHCHGREALGGIQLARNSACFTLATEDAPAVVIDPPMAPVSLPAGLPFLLAALGMLALSRRAWA